MGKKKGGKKEGGKKKDDGKPKIPASQNPKNIEEVVMFEEIYTLDKEKGRVDGLFKDNDALKSIAKELRVRLDKHLEVQKQQIDEKNAEIDAKDKLTASLDADIVQLVKDVEELKRGNEEELDDTQKKHFKQVLALEEQMNELRRKYDTLLEFRDKKPQLTKRLDEYHTALEDERNEHKLNAEKLNRRNVLEKDRLKNEMLRKIKETKLSLLAMTEDQLHTTTKRTIMENEQMTTELQYQSKESDRLDAQNEKLLKENAELKRILELKEKQQQVLATRTRFYQKLVKKVGAQVGQSVKQQQIVFKKEVEFHGRKQKAISLQLDENNKMIQFLESTITDLEDMVKQAKLETQQTNAQVIATRRASASMVELQRSATTLLLGSLAVVEKQIKVHNDATSQAPQDDYQPKIFDENEGRQIFRMPKRLSALTPREKETLIRTLLHKLNIAPVDNPFVAEGDGLGV